MQHRALIVIDVQNDYFADGAYPLWQAASVAEKTVTAIGRARAAGMPVILVQHVADAARGTSPFFNAGTEGVAIHPSILAAAPDAPVVVKTRADAFIGTTLAALLQDLGVRQVLVCGMMTQNCVTHTAMSPSAAALDVTVLKDCCTTVDAMVHGIALSALSDRVPLALLDDILPG